MNIILVSSSSSKARTFTLGAPQLSMLMMGAFLAIISLAVLLHYFSLRYAIVNDSPYLRSLLVSLQAQENERMQTYLRDSLNTMASKVGELQARLLRVDALGERLTKVARLKPQDFMFDRVPGRGGAESSLPSTELSMKDLGITLDKLSKDLEDRTDKLRVLESMLTEDSAKRQLMPSGMPTEGGFYSSNFGWRIDPFTGLNAFHEGVDFMAEEGTPVLAAAGGVVIFAGVHPQYGNMIEIDHGNDLVTRYAHTSKLLVKVGDVVLRGGRIAEVGNTGRSTGAHLHFEVRHRGVAQNPARFLRMPG
ncbi:MAG TPA: M23 family metallopeptidase [Burkholderiales bacterium]|nr:M23 family metallopeptidase [Burkholderiales bacterium]